MFLSYTASKNEKHSCQTLANTRTQQRKQQLLRLQSYFRALVYT